VTSSVTHGVRNIGDVPPLVVSMDDRGTLRQTWPGKEPV
jgi:hypothetical protein